MSLLLDALKKAALEKQRRDQNGGIDPAPNHNLQSASSTSDHNTPLDSLTSRDAPNHLEKEINLAIDDPVTLVDTHDLGDAYLDLSLRTPTEISNSDSASTPHEEEFNFEIDEFELNPEEPVAHEIISSIAVFAPLDHGTGDLEQAAISIEPIITDSLSASNSDSDVITPAKADSHKQEPATPLPTTTPPTTTKPSSEPDPKTTTVDNPITAPYTKEVGKSAFAQLLNKSQHARKIEKRKNKLFLIALMATASALIGLYYFYLMESKPMQLAPMRNHDAATDQDAITKSGAENEIQNATNGNTDSKTDSKTDNQTETSDAPLTSDATTEQKPAKETITSIDQSAAIATAPAANITPRPMKENKEQAEKIEKAKAIEKPNTLIAPATKTEAIKPTELNRIKSSRRSRPEERVAVDPYRYSEAIKQGYEAYQRGDIAAADSAYQEALRLSPKHRDAILGAAAVAASQGRNTEAMRLYQQQLQANPQDTHARAGMMSLVVNDRENSQMETQLNLMLRDNPDAAYLHFMKGSQHARRQEWPDAQNAFFNAWQRDSGNPDYAFNLAVSLDHLGASNEALNYYRKALQLSAGRGANFAAKGVETRIQTLEALTP